MRRKAGAIPVGLVVAWGALLLLAFPPFRGFDPASVGRAAVGGWQGSAFHFAFLRETAGRAVAGHAGVAVWAAAVAGFGLPLVGLFRVAGAGADRIAFALGLGFAAGCLGWLGAGLAGLWFPSVAWAAAAAGIVLLIKGRRRAPRRRKPVSAWRGIPLFFGAMAAAVLAVFLPASLLPESAADPLLYHLALPGYFAMEHRVVSVTQMFHGSLPMGAPMHYGWMLMLAGEVAVRAWRWWVLAATLWLIYRLCAREGFPGAGLVAAGVFAALPQTVWVGVAAFVDGEVCLLGLLACMAVRGNRFLLAAVLGAAACGVKYQGVFLLPGLVVAAGFGRWRLALRRAVVVAVVTVVVVAPWWARNEAVMGNPVYPFAGAVFRAFRPIPPANRALLARHTESKVLWGPHETALFPWKSAKGMNEETRLGPVFLLAVPWLVLAPPAGPFAPYARIAVVSAVAWALTTHVSRYLTAGWALACVLVAVSLSEPPLRLVRAGLLAVFGLDILVRTLPGFLATGVPVLAGRASPRAAWAEALPNSYARIAELAGRELPASARIILVGDIRAAYWPRPAINHSPYDVQVADEILSSSRGPAEAAKRFRQRAGWVYVNDRESGRLKFTRDFPMLAFDARTERIAAAVWRDWMDEAVRADGGVVWRVRRSPRRSGAAPRVPLTFDGAALKRAFGPATSLSWDSPGGGTTTIEVPE